MADTSELCTLFQAALDGSSVLLARLATETSSFFPIFNGWPAQDPQYPCVSWDQLDDDLDNRIHSGPDRSVTLRLQVNCWATGSSTLTGQERNRVISGVIDGLLIDKPVLATWESTNWLVRTCRRTGGWKELTADGMLFQRTADFELKAVRKA